MQICSFMSLDINLLIFKFELTMDTYKGYAYSKSRLSQFVFSHESIHIIKLKQFVRKLNLNS